MVWIAVSIIVVVVSVIAVAGASRRQGRDAAPTRALTARLDDSIAARIRRLEDDTSDLTAQVSELREDVEYLRRQLEDSP